MRMRLAILIFALVLVTTGCSIEPTTAERASPSTTTTSPAPTASLPCQDVIHTQDRPNSDLSVVLGQVAMPTRDALQANRSGESAPSSLLFAKTGLFVASGASFELIVPAEWVGRVTIGWGSPGPRTTHLYVSGCKATGSQKAWLVFPGGFWVGEPACIPLLVKAGSREALVHIGVGASCPGRRPPPSPG